MWVPDTYELQLWGCIWIHTKYCVNPRPHISLLIQATLPASGDQLNNAAGMGCPCDSIYIFKVQ